MQDTDRAISAFWTFWARSADTLEAAIEADTLLDWVEEIQAHVEAIHEGMDWEFGPGETARHYFCVSAKGDPEVRVQAERWRAAGPADGEVFEFRPSRPGSATHAETVIAFDQAQFPVEDFRFQAELDLSRERVRVGVYHPTFAAVEEKLRMTATFLALDGLLGEDDVERWLGGIDLLEAAPANGVNPLGLLATVAELRQQATGERFAVLRGQTPDGKPVVLSANLAVKRVDHLLLDTHHTVTLPLAAPRPDGLTEPEEAETLDALEDELLAELGADVVYLGRETREGVRVLHLHGSATGPVVRLERWSAGHPERAITWAAAPDPGWSTLGRW